MRRLVDSGDENEPQIRIQALDRTVEIPHYLPESRQLAIVVHHVQQRCVIFVNDDDGFLPGLLEGAMNQPLQTLVGIYIFFAAPVDEFIPLQLVLKSAYQLLLIQMLGRGHVEMKNRMPRPFLLHLARFQSLEKFLPALEITMESRRQQ